MRLDSPPAGRRIRAALPPDWKRKMATRATGPSKTPVVIAAGVMLVALSGCTSPKATRLQQSFATSSETADAQAGPALTHQPAALPRPRATVDGSGELQQVAVHWVAPPAMKHSPETEPTLGGSLQKLECVGLPRDPGPPRDAGPHVIGRRDAIAPDAWCPRSHHGGPVCDARIRYPVAERRLDPVYTPGGVHAFVTLFNEAAARGVENATIRAFNGTMVAPAYADCGSECPPPGVDFPEHLPAPPASLPAVQP